MTRSTTDLSPVAQPQHRVLPMSGRTHGNRSPVTCHLRCGDACSMAVPNTTETSYFREVAAKALSRRAVLGGGTAAGIALAATSAPAAAGPGSHRGPGPHGLRFTPISPVPTTVDDVRVPAGYEWDAIIRWGDPLFKSSPPFDPTKQSGERQAQQFGYNNDYLDIIETNRDGTRALLVCNHEYTNEGIMFPPGTDPAEVIRTAWAAHGMSVVELERRSPRPTLVLREGWPEQPADHHRHPVRRRRSRRRVRTAQDRRGQHRQEGPRHHEQLRRRHHPVGHRALG